jgi:mRNA-degrading endonuclease toxin of MazEF toxin-antitoxin module
VASRGDVLVALRRLGFGATGRPEHFAVLQSEEITSDDFVIVAPLEAAASMYQSYPLAVHVTAREAGASGPHVVLPCLLAAAAVDRFAPTRAGRLTPASMGRVDQVLRLALGLR